LTSILDGNGYSSVSGSHGKRGYVGRYMFNWLGATTPIPERTHGVMAQLGNRILFYEVVGDEWPEEKLVDFAKNVQTNIAMNQCNKAVNDFLEGHFQKHPVESVDPKSIDIPEELTLQIVRYARLISHGRLEVQIDDFTGEAEGGAPEGPHRVILLLQV